MMREFEDISKRYEFMSSTHMREKDGLYDLINKEKIKASAIKKICYELEREVRKMKKRAKERDRLNKQD